MWQVLERMARLRFQLLAGLGLVLAVVVPGQALGSRSAHSASASASSARRHCSFSWYDPKRDAPDLKGQQANQLDLVRGTFGLNSADSKLRVLLNVMNLSKTIPAPANYMDYLVYWTNPAGDKGPNAVDASVTSSGVAFSDGTVTVVNGNTQYTAAGKNAATGSFGHGANGKIEIDVPLRALGLRVGKVLKKPIGQSADGANSPFGSLGGVSETDNGQSYTVGKPSCIDPR